ncbi:BT1 family [Lotmaria passim]
MRARRALSNSGRSAIGIFTSAGLQAARAVLFLVIWDGAKKNAVERQEDGVFLLRLEALKQQQTDSDPLKDGAVTCANATDKVDVQAQFGGADSS